MSTFGCVPVRVLLSVPLYVPVLGFFFMSRLEPELPQAAWATTPGRAT
jgi:hypothetical protein